MSGPDDLSELDAIVAGLIDQLAGWPEGRGGRDAVLCDLGNTMLALYSRTRRPSFLDAAVGWFAAAWSDAAPGDPLRARYAANHAAALLARYRATKAPADLAEAVRRAGDAVELTSPDSPDLPGRLHNLGNALEKRFLQHQDVADLDEAMRIRHKALRLLPEGSPLTAALETAAGTTARTRFERSGDRAGLDAAIEHHRRALKAAVPGEPTHTAALSNLGISLLDRGDVDEAVSCAESAAQATGQDDPYYGVRLSNLGLALRRQYERVGGAEVLDRAIRLHIQAVAALSAEDPQYPVVVANLGAAHHLRFRHQGLDDDLNEAVGRLRLASRSPTLSDAERTRWLGTLGSVVLSHFGRHDDAASLEEAISVLTSAVDGTPEGHVDRALRLHNLATAYYVRCVSRGEPESLDRAVSLHAAAVRAAARGTRTAAIVTAGLAGDLESRYNLRRSATDLARAIELSRIAIAGVDQHDPDRPTWESNLGNMLARRYRLSRDRADLDESIERLRSAAAATPDRHADLVLRLTALSEALLVRFESFRGREDIDEAVALCERAAGSTCANSLQRASALNDLGAVLLARAEHSDDPQQDLERSIAVQEEAVRDYPQDHPDYVTALRSLGRTLRSRAGRPWGAPDDADRAVALLTRAVGLPTARPGRDGSITWSELAHAYRARGLAAAQTPAGTRDLVRSREAGLRAVREARLDVLIQSGTADGLAAVRFAAHQVRTVTGWCLDDEATNDVVTVIELGRGLVLHATTVTGSLADRLRDAGHPELAERWNAERSRALAPGRAGRMGRASREPDDLVPSQLRLQAINVLAAQNGNSANTRRAASTEECATSAEASSAGLFATPAMPAVRAALATTGNDSLVYLVPGNSLRDGYALVATVGGELRQLRLPRFRAVPGGPLAICVERFNGYLTAVAQRTGDDRDEQKRMEAALAEWISALTALCDWAWDAVMEPLIAVLRAMALGGPVPGIVLVPIGHATLVPWHAARLADPSKASGYHYAVEDAIFSYAASARLFCDAADRRLPELDGRALIVADPTRDLPFAAAEGRRIHRTCYPGGSFLGPAGFSRIAAATPEAVLSALPGAHDPGMPVVHLACHGRMRPDPADSYLALAEGRRLTLEDLLAHGRERRAGAGGCLVVLSACTSSLTTDDFDEALTLATTFLAAGAATVIGSLWLVEDRRTAELMAEFHRRLTAHDRPRPAAALREAQLWMLNVSVDGSGPPASTGRAPAADFADPYCWAAFTHQGR